MTLQLTLKSNMTLEFAFGKVTPSKEMTLYSEYFPAISPLIVEHGCQQLGSFVVLASNQPKGGPEMGALTQWPAVENFNAFNSDSRFLEAKVLLDDAMEIYSNGHFFATSDEDFEIRTDIDYAIVISNDKSMSLTPVLNLPLEINSPQQKYVDKSLLLSRWNESADKLLENASAQADVFKVRFNQPAP